MLVDISALQIMLHAARLWVVDVDCLLSLCYVLCMQQLCGLGGLAVEAATCRHTATRHYELTL